MSYLVKRGTDGDHHLDTSPNIWEEEKKKPYTSPPFAAKVDNPALFKYASNHISEGFINTDKKDEN